MKTLLAVDGNSILNRAFYGIRPLTTRDGFPTNALYGMANMLMRQLSDLSPDRCAVAFDLKAPTFRHKKYDGYKAGRKPMPEELAKQLPVAHELCRALGFSVIETEGYEADDILGTLSAMGEADGDTRVFIFTGDRDSLQLISGKTSVVLATNKENILFDEARFLAEYGVPSSVFVDVKAIMGDSSDNIPGVPGIGEKGAVKLIAQFGSLDGVYGGYSTAGSGVTPSVAAKLEAGRDSAYLSLELARICRNVPGLPALDELDGGKPHAEEIRELLTRLEFTKLLARLDLPETAPAPMPKCDAPQAVTGGHDDFFEALRSSDKKAVVLSFDGTDFRTFDGTLLCTVPADSETTAAANAARGYICYDCKSIYERLDRISDPNTNNSRGAGFDVMLAAYVLNPQGNFDLRSLAAQYLGDNTTGSDAELAFRLKPVLEEKLRASDSERLFSGIEMPLAAVLADMEEAGFLIDRAGIAGYGDLISEKSTALAAEICDEAGVEFNINSPKQLGEVLFERLSLPYGKKTKTGYSTNADILEKLAPDYKIVRDVLEYRKLTKLYSTYVVGLLKVADENGRIHTQFKQTGTATGRLSSAEPNLQNIPIRTDEGRELRKYFIAAPGRVLIDADYSQIELRLLAHISGDAAMISAFTHGADIHTSTAAAVFGVAPEDVTPELRKRAKAVNFGIVYGIGDFSLAGDLGIPVKQARAYIQSYLASYPDVAAYLKDIVAEAHAKGYVTTLFGRRRYIPEISGHNAMQRKFGERVAMNSPIQGSAADIVKIAMLGVSRRLAAEELDAKLILQVHDELIVEASKKDADRAAAILREEMEGAVKLSVPLTVDLSIGERWYGM
ncbi:MAG: DNA polymerase I [Eubacteriales bacterium]